MPCTITSTRRLRRQADAGRGQFAAVALQQLGCQFAQSQAADVW